MSKKIEEERIFWVPKRYKQTDNYIQTNISKIENNYNNFAINYLGEIGKKRPDNLS